MGARGHDGVSPRSNGDGDARASFEELAELALHERWVSTLDEWYDDGPNLDGERGITLGRLESLLEAWAKRTHTDRHAAAVAVALAHHAPDRVDELKPAKTARGTTKAAKAERWF